MAAKFEVRNYRPHEPKDAAAYGRLRKGAVLAHLLSHPYYEADKNLFFAEANGIVIGYINVLPELGIGRVVLDYGVSPSQWPEAVLKELLKNALKRAKELRARVVHLSLPLAEAAQARVLSTLGFKPVRRFYELRLNISEVNLEAAGCPDFAHRCLEAGEEEMLAHIQSRCFAGTWGYNPNTVEEIAWQLKIKNNCPEGVILAMDKGEVVGYCWTETVFSTDLSIGKQGRVYMLGVDADYRGKGLGRKLLLAGLLHLRDKGREFIDITVDSQNIAAVTLYRSLGFQLHDETVWYEKAL
jgi:mycothiol synthase